MTLTSSPNEQPAARRSGQAPEEGTSTGYSLARSDGALGVALASLDLLAGRYAFRLRAATIFSDESRLFALSDGDRRLPAERPNR